MAVCTGFAQVRLRQGAKIVRVTQHIGAGIEDVEKGPQIRKPVGVAQFIGRARCWIRDFQRLSAPQQKRRTASPRAVYKKST
jgi:hypothetical protein